MTVDPRTGEPLLRLPQKHVHVIEIDLAPAERSVYEAVYLTTKNEFDSLLASGKALSSYIHMFAMLLKLRQVVCHPLLAFPGMEANNVSLDNFAQSCGASHEGELALRLIEEVLRMKSHACVNCGMEADDTTPALCGHVLCPDCVLSATRNSSGECPVCHETGLSKNGSTTACCARPLPRNLPEEMQSSKIRVLLKYLQADVAAGHHVVVFSQWPPFLALIGRALEGLTPVVPWRQFDGSLSTARRRQALDWLKHVGPQTGRVLLISLMAGCVGLNLTAATRLYMMDLWWNPALEEQAMQRIHRIGQTQEVHIYKFVTRNSIEEGVLKLQRSKSLLSEGLLKGGHLRGCYDKLGLEDFKLLLSRD